MDKYTGKIGEHVFIADGAQLSGPDINIGKDSGIWYNAVLRSSHSSIDIGERTNIQDNCVLHAEEGKPISIGHDVTVGHSAIVHACTVGDNTLIGMGAVVLNGAKIGDDCIVGAGALVTGKMDAPAGSMILGSPAKVVRPLTEAEIESNRASARGYLHAAEQYRKG